MGFQNPKFPGEDANQEGDYFALHGQETAPSQRFLTAGALPAAAIPPRHAMRNSMASPFASEIVKQVRVHHGHQATGISPTKKRVLTRVESYMG